MKISKSFFGFLSRHPWAAVLAACLVVFLVLPAVQAQAAYYIPKLASMPDLDLSKYPVVQSGKNISVPFLSIFISEMYRLALGAGMIATAVMIVWGGFRYIVGSTTSDVTRAKQIITDAIVGLVLLLCGYTLLKIVNPQMTTLKSIEIESIPRNAMTLAYFESIATQNVTAPPTPVATKVLDKPVPLPPPEVVKEEIKPGGDCPMANTVPGSDKMITNANLIPFYDAVMSRVSAKTFPERVKQVADFAVRCKVNLGSCGQTMGRIWGMAGVMDNAFLHVKNNETQYGGKIFNMTVKLAKPVPYLYPSFTGLHCDNDCKENLKKSDCVAGKSSAVARARQIAESKGGADYPDAYVDQLQAGDWIQFYTANRDCAGNHSVIFVGWKDDKGMAITITGQVRNAKKPDAKVEYANFCLKKSCGGYYPIVAISRPKPELLTNFSPGVKAE